jgi:AsmA protein
LLFLAPYLVGGRPTDLGLKSAAVFAASRDTYSLSSPVRLIEAPRIALESGTISVPHGRTGLARGGEMIAMLLTGKSARMALEKAAFVADFTTNEATYTQGSAVAGVAPLVASLQKLQFDALAVRDSSIRIKTEGSPDLVLDDLFADVTAKASGTIRVVGSFTFRGEKVAFDTTIGARPDQSGSRPIAASLESAMLTASLEGTFLLSDSPRLMSPKAELSVPKLRDAARWLGAGWPRGSAFENFHVKGQLEWVDHTVAFQNASVQMDGNAATGTLSVNFTGARPALDGTLDLKTLDLTKYADGGEVSGKPDCLLTLLSGASGLQFPLIQIVDADLRISSGTVVLPRVTIGRSAATISLKNGKMLADIAELEIDDGTRGGGQLRIDTNGRQPSFDIRGKLEALDLGRAGLAIFGHQTIQGRGDIVIEVATAGDTGLGLLSGLDGKLSVTLVEGGRLGLDVEQLAAAVNSAQPHDAWEAASSGAMPIDSLDARFAVARGIIRTESAEAVAGARAMKAEGAIDLTSRKLDLELAIGDRARADAPDSAAPRKREVIDMHGPWTRPSLRRGIDSRQPEPVPNPG